MMLGGEQGQGMREDLGRGGGARGEERMMGDRPH